MPHFSILCFVLRWSLIACQEMKECLGIFLENQISLCQETLSFALIIFLNAFNIEKLSLWFQRTVSRGAYLTPELLSLIWGLLEDGYISAMPRFHLWISQKVWFLCLRRGCIPHCRRTWQASFPVGTSCRTIARFLNHHPHYMWCGDKSLLTS